MVRIKKPSKWCFEAGKLFCQMLNVLREKTAKVP